ncbi:MAG TPA: GNAT family N-acetyltransferase [Candidatus Limnocylindrales bacterium]|nr:GNAT family N-acetyltransferase [Candidatus Limnocylindrales bacterium]
MVGDAGQMIDDELARLEHANNIAAGESVARNVAGGLVRHADGLAIVASGLPLRLFNQILVEDTRATPKAMAAAVALMRDRAAPFLVHLRDGTDDGFRAAMAELGLVDARPDEPTPGMALHPIPAELPDTPGLEIRPCVDRSGFDDHLRLAAAGFGMDETLIRSFLTDALLTDPAVRLYVGYAEGEPVSTGMGFLTGRVVGIYNISTIESARRRGFGAAMTRRVAHDGAAAGCDVAILQSSAMGRPVYERLGYRTVVRYRAFVEGSDPS